MIAWVVLIFWPMICIIFYQKMSLPAALCTTIIGGYLLLPSVTSLDLPLLPSLNKTTIPTLTALVLTAIVLGRQTQAISVLPGWIPRNPLILCLMAMLVIGIFGTVMTNQDPLSYGPRRITGLRLYDAFSMLLNLLITLIPFLLARKVLSSPDGQRVLLIVLVISGVIYCLPALYEVRMSPQLHNNVYGFHPSSFSQSMRNGGFRPNVFLNHGLSLAIFLTYTLIAAAGLFGIIKGPSRWKLAMGAVWMFATLVLCKTLGALMIAIVLVPIALFCRPRLQIMIAACIAGILMTYPLLRVANVIPVPEIVNLVENIDQDRAASLAFRFRNEDILLEHARKRPVFGWGSWKRNRVFNEKGQDISVTDGTWIIQFGVGGWVRYFSVFGLLCWPVIGLFFARRENVDPICAILALVLSAKLIDLLPNSGLIPLIWLMAGSLLGRLEMRAITGEQALNTPQMRREKANVARPGQVSGPGFNSPDHTPRYARSFPQKGKDSGSAKDIKRERKHSRYSSRMSATEYRR